MRRNDAGSLKFWAGLIAISLVLAACGKDHVGEEEEASSYGYGVTEKILESTEVSKDADIGTGGNEGKTVSDDETGKEEMASTDTEESTIPDEEKQKGVDTAAVRIDGCATRELVAINLSGDDGAQTYLSATDGDGNELTKGVYLSWRAYEEDLDEKHQVETEFTVYRNDQVLASGLKVTNCVDETGKASDVYRVEGTSDAELSLTSGNTAVWNEKYLEIQLNKPEDGKLPNGQTCKYTANDMSVGDLDGDGRLDLVVKWYPDNAQDNSKEGITGKTYLDGYKIDFATGEASQLWRIDLGINIRSGAHYTQFQVWDYDGDGIAEIAMKTADGTTTYQIENGALKETGYVGACNADSQKTEELGGENDYRTAKGYILSGPEYFTMFDGLTGRIIDTVEYTPLRGKVNAWGDGYGNRVDRFLAGTAYLDGEHPYAVFCRGYYTRTCITAYYLTKNDKGEREIGTYWAFDTDTAGAKYKGQGNHSLAINDVDGDGKDEIIYGSLVVDDDGQVLYTTGLGHGDADHVSDWIPSRPGLEYMGVHEDKNAKYHVEIHDAATGEILTGYFTGRDTGRGMTSDIDPRYEGAEYWSVANPSYTGQGEPAWNNKKANIYSSLSGIYDPKDIEGSNMIVVNENGAPPSNFSIYWDGDLLAEMQDHTFDSKAYAPLTTTIEKWDYEKGESRILLESDEIFTSNGTKGNLGLVADLVGDWREEIIARCSNDASRIRVYSTTIQTDYCIPCLLTNRAYREGIAWQNTAYNQPAHTSYLISEGLITAKLSEGETTGTQAEILFTAANDGTRYGHPVTGYVVERANVDKNGNISDYEEVALEWISEVQDFAGGNIPSGILQKKGDSYVYRDSSVKGGTAYAYKIAAIVDGKKSFYSLPFIVEIP